MKISCDVIRDLLPLYYDNICSEESRKLVNEHIETCEKCKMELESMSMVIDVTKKNLDEMEMMKNVSRRWRRDKLKSLGEGILITIIVVLILSCFIRIKSF
ncbi:zf-HC2 domain-containing protein [Clostridium sp. MSJ-11]|uniref:Zf-HC2 domain-containing protein n=1 Tax=Clostridium mobile TaxID=2841512 RepID=A0ABS6EJ83_9CLOT|nr:zf-HC2 domain-containing protein [Clostridium mobile]MBU5485202.1 zf-HC2 domain-containing protein [Clostridium mobile]